MACIASRGRYPSFVCTDWSIGIIDDRDDGNAAPESANHRSTSGLIRTLPSPRPRLFGESGLSMRPFFPDERGLPGFFIETLFAAVLTKKNYGTPDLDSFPRVIKNSGRCAISLNLAL